MGRTVPTYTRLIEERRRELERYRDALRRKDRKSFERIIEDSQKHRDAGKEMASYDSFKPMLLSIILEQEKRIERLEDKLGDLEGKK
ncbi:MAG: hypothetical protein ACLFUR_03780 [Candidatus Hadarchaeia archaeon]